MTTKSKTKTPPPVLPAHLAELPAVADVATRVAEAKATRTAAQTAARDARAAAEGAQAVDDAALQAAVEAGESDPEPTKKRREDEAVAARRRLDAANVIVGKTTDEFRAALVQHRAELDAVQAPRVNEAGSEFLATLDTLATQLGDLAGEAGTWRGLYAVNARRESTAADERTRMRGLEPTAAVPSFDPVRNTGAEHIAALRALVEELLAQPTPAPDRRAERTREREAKAERKRQEQAEQEQRVASRRQRSVKRGDSVAP